jgi:hypothetical protein
VQLEMCCFHEFRGVSRRRAASARTPCAFPLPRISASQLVCALPAESMRGSRTSPSNCCRWTGLAQGSSMKAGASHHRATVRAWCAASPGAPPASIRSARLSGRGILTSRREPPHCPARASGTKQPSRKWITTTPSTRPPVARAPAHPRRLSAAKGPRRYRQPHASALRVSEVTGPGTPVRRLLERLTHG